GGGGGPLGRMVGSAGAQGAATATAVMPASEQVDRSRWSVLAAAGFRLDTAMLGDTTLVDAVRRVGDGEDAIVVDLVREFRRHRDAGLYYRLDEHLNARGQAFAAPPPPHLLAP